MKIELDLKDIVGNIMPMGESYHDKKIVGNYIKYSEAIYTMLDELIKVSKMDDRCEGSVQKCVALSKAILSEIVEIIEEGEL